VKKKLFRDPIHGYIEVTGCALDIVDNPFFQRLRRIKQLSFTNFVYHGAEHSRFGHSLGVYHLAKRVSDLLLSDEEKDIQEEFCLAALLHDIGHHPFSHSFESALDNAYQGTGLSFDHEDYTLKIIENTDVGVCIEDYGLNKEHVIQLLLGSYTEKAHLQYLNNLISSEFDLDRVDYLLRDSYYCGVPYGKIDLERLLHSIESEEDHIIISERGIHSIEMYVLSRFYMYIQVYTHHTSRAFDLMLQKIITKQVIDEYCYPKIDDDINEFLKYDDCWLRMLIKELSTSSDFDHKELSKQLISRKPIKCVIEKSALMDRMSRHIDPEYTTLSNMRYALESLSKMSGVDKEYIFIDEPWMDLPYRYQPYIPTNITSEEPTKYEEKKPILIRTKKGLKDIAQEPNSIAYHISKFLAQVVRIYTLDEHRKALSQAIETMRPDISHLIWKDKY